MFCSTLSRCNTLFPLLPSPALPASCFSFRTLSCPVPWQPLATGSPWRSHGRDGGGAQGPSVQAPGWVVAGSPLGSPLSGRAGDQQWWQEHVVFMLGCPVSNLSLRAPQAKAPPPEVLGGLGGTCGQCGSALGMCAVEPCELMGGGCSASYCGCTGSLETSWPEGHPGWPGSLWSLPVAGVGACGRWPGLSLQGVGILYQGPKSSLGGVQGCGQHDTPAGPSSQKCPPSRAPSQGPVGKACSCSSSPRPVLRVLRSPGAFLCLLTMLLPSRFQACLQPV